MNPTFQKGKTKTISMRYYLHGETGSKIHAFLATTAWNMKKMMEILKEKNYTLFLNLVQNTLKKNNLDRENNDLLGSN